MNKYECPICGAGDNKHFHLDPVTGKIIEIREDYREFYTGC